jgi:DNA-binding CsgD family transcriptional regulator
MLELLMPMAPRARTAPYAGPERRSAQALVWRWLAGMLDEVDYGMLLVVDETHVMHANHVARAELDAHHALQLVGRELRVSRPHDVAPLRDALADATRKGLRRLLTLGDEANRVCVAIVPLAATAPDGGRPTLLVFGKRKVCQALSADWYARTHRLTHAETLVLQGLCEGARPHEIAQRQGVAISTVRTQISSIRAKTGAQSIRDVVSQVAVLPPLVSALRAGHSADGPPPEALALCA